MNHKIKLLLSERGMKHADETKFVAAPSRSPIPSRRNMNPAAILQRARLDISSLTPAAVIQLQRSIGNQAVGRLLSGFRPGPVQRKPDEYVSRLLQQTEMTKASASTLKAAPANTRAYREIYPADKQPVVNSQRNVQYRMYNHSPIVTQLRQIGSVIQMKPKRKFGGTFYSKHIRNASNFSSYGDMVEEALAKMRDRSQSQMVSANTLIFMTSYQQTLFCDQAHNPFDYTGNRFESTTQFPIVTISSMGTIRIYSAAKFQYSGAVGGDGLLEIDHFIPGSVHGEEIFRGSYSDYKSKF